MINIVVPMAGRGSRFVNAGYKMPKPLIDVNGHCMIEWVVKNLTPNGDHRFIFLCLKEHIDKFNLPEILGKIAPGCVIVPVDHVTEGAACTVLLAEDFINNDDELMIANSDQYVACDINEYIKSQGDYDGLIMTMYADDDKWSFIAFDEKGYVTMVREKEVISNEATVGIYNFQRGSDYVKYAHKMIDRNLRVKNEFYVAPVYNLLIEEEKKIVYKNIGSVGNGMYGLGVPEDLNAFLTNPISEQF